MSWHGALVVDKPAGLTSHDVVDRIRRILRTRRVGHTGTLDPQATGVLPICVGLGTRLVRFLQGADKSYRGTIRLGFSTDTYDAAGTRTGEPRPVDVTLEQVRRAAASLTGRIDQVPPLFSAKKIGGQPLYKLARKGVDVERKPVEVHVHRFDVQELRDDRVDFEVVTSAGGYVRSLAHELGEVLGCGGHLESLVRTAAGRFVIDDALSLDEVDELHAKGLLDEHFIPLADVLPDLPAATLTDRGVADVRTGRFVTAAELTAGCASRVGDHVRLLAPEGQLVAMAEVQAAVGSEVASVLQPRIVFPE